MLPKCYQRRVYWAYNLMSCLKERGYHMRQSFIVNIQNQQNSTWQGTVTWVDEDRTQSFRSVLELIRLIDSTLCTRPNTPLEGGTDS